MTTNAYSKYVLLKSAVEDLFGSEARDALKESNHIPTWTKYAKRTLRAVLQSIEDTVELYDDDWLQEIRSQIDRGIDYIDKLDSIDDIIAAIAGSLINVSFLQIGLMPRRKGSSTKHPLRKGAWKLNQFRSVVYLQTKEQKEAVFWSKQQRRIGVQAQLDLYHVWAESEANLPYSEWCEENESSA